MTDKRDEKHNDSPPHSDPKGVNPRATGPAQPGSKPPDEKGAASAAPTARADEDTYD